jgi:hemolysin activation/secretion protein
METMRLVCRTARLSALVIGICLGTSAFAQPSVAPGDISRQLEPVRVPALPTLQGKAQRITRPSSPQPGSVLIRVQQWRIQGNSILSDEVLLSSLQPFTGVDLSFQQIREAAAVLQQSYDESGWLARVDVPAQDVTDGRITLQITEGRLGDVKLDAQSTSRVSPQRLADWVASGHAAGQFLSTRRLGRGLLLADDLPGVSVVGALQASARPGATDVILSTVAEQPYSLDVSLDNHNARTVGASRLSVNSTWNSPAGFGELYTAQAFKSEGSEYLGLGASAPLGYDGVRVGANVSRLNYEIVTPDSDGRAQDIHGRSESLGLDLSYPLLRSRQANLFASAGLEQRRYEGYANGQRNSDYEIEAGRVGLSANLFDDWGGGAANSLRLSWRHGEVMAGQRPVAPAVAGAFRKLSWTLSRQQALGNDLSLLVALTGQNTGDKVLDGSENFSLGGPNAVRAYPVSEGSGPQGRVLNVELRYRIGPQWVVTPFYDRGDIEKRTADQRSAYRLEGAGIGVMWNGPGGWAARLSWAHRLGNNPNANTSTGSDQDGSFIRNRAWFSLARSI